MLSELLSFRARKDDTEKFRRLRHDEHLCPRFRDQTERMLDAYISHRTHVRDIQGFDDEGADVLLQYREDDEVKRLGLQVKSFSEIRKWANGHDKFFLKNLKAQVATAHSNMNLEHVYVLLCTDAEMHQKQVRRVSSALKKFDYVTVVLPHHAITFYELSEIEVVTTVARILCDEDFVLSKARRELAWIIRDAGCFDAASVA